MDKKDKNCESHSNRRNFLKKGLLLGGGVVIGSGVNKALSDTDDSEKKITALTPEGEVVEISSSHIQKFKHKTALEAQHLREGIPDRKFVMVIDLSRCKDVRNCQKGCRKMHHLPEETNWLKVLRMQDSEITQPYWMPKPCFHCDNPPCTKVCPVGATFKREDGIVLIDNDRCIGCRFCMAACPYSARSFNWSKPVEVMNEMCDDKVKCNSSIPRKMGTVEKCDFCPDILAQGKLPECVSSCPNGVYYIGDLNEDTVTNGSETVRFSELIKKKAGYRFLEGLGTQPSVYYLPAANRLFPFKEEDTNNQNTL